MARLRLPLAVLLLLASLVPLAAASPAAAARPMGSQPLDDILGAASANVRPECGLTRDRLAAMMIAITYPETGASTTAPSPMTLSRFDVNNGLFAFNDPNTAFRRAFFNPGIGMWQFDSAGLGQPHAANYYINTATAAPAAASTLATRWCTAWNNPATYPGDVERRAYVWQPWHACKATSTGPGRCEMIIGEILTGDGTLVNMEAIAGVTRTGGMQQRRCQDRATKTVLDCWWVNPALAEGYGAGNVGWANPNSTSGSPLSAPFYVYELNGNEYRHWVAADTGYAGDISASRPLNRNARGNLTWRSGPGVCDLTLNRGGCAVEPPLGPDRPVTPTNPSIVGQGLGVGMVTYNGQTAVAERRSDGSTKVSFYAPPLWSDAIHLGGVASSDPELAAYGNDHLEVFIRGSDGAIWHNVLAGGGASGWYSLGGQFTSGPAAVSWGPGRIDVFARGLDGALWSGYLDNGIFSGWYSLGGQIISDPEVSSWGPDRYDVFAVGTDKGLYHRAWVGNGFGTWDALGGSLTAAPAASSSATNRIDIVVRGAGGGAFARTWDGSTFTPYVALGGTSASAPELAASSPTTALLVVRGVDGQLYGRQRAADGTWFPYVRIP